MAALVSVVGLVQFRWMLPAALTLCYAFLTIRHDEATIMDFISWAVRYFISTQQLFFWR